MICQLSVSFLFVVGAPGVRLAVLADLEREYHFDYAQKNHKLDQRRAVFPKEAEK